MGCLVGLALLIAEAEEAPEVRSIGFLDCLFVFVFLGCLFVFVFLDCQAQGGLALVLVVFVEVLSLFYAVASFHCVPLNFYCCLFIVV